MEIITEKMSREQKKYILTEEEFKQLQQSYWDGVSDLTRYIAFCIKNYRYKFNLGGQMNFVEDVVCSISETGRLDIRNTYNLSFKRWREYKRSVL